MIMFTSNFLVLLLLVCVIVEAKDTSPLACESPYWSGTQNVTVMVGDDERTFELYTPWQGRGECGAKYCTGPPLLKDRGLVINWHGCNAHLPLLDYQTEISKVTEEAKDRGYYSITPLGTRSPDGNYGWNADGIPCGKPGIDDFAFFESIIDFISSKLCVNLKKVYSVGFSTGAFLSYGIACRYPDVIAGIGADAGGLSKTYYEKCREGTGSVPVQAFHSLSDPTVPYNGTDLWAGQLEMDELWRERNGCIGTEVPSTTFNSNTTICLKWACPLAPVETCTLQDIDHCWYGGRSGGFVGCERRKGDVDATRHMFDAWESED